MTFNPMAFQLSSILVSSPNREENMSESPNSAREILQTSLSAGTNPSPPSPPSLGRTKKSNGLDRRLDGITDTEKKLWLGWYHSIFPEDYDTTPEDWAQDWFTTKFKQGNYVVAHKKTSNGAYNIFVIPKSAVKNDKIPDRPRPLKGLSPPLMCLFSDIHTCGDLKLKRLFPIESLLKIMRIITCTTYLPDEVKRIICTDARVPFGMLMETFKKLLEQCSYDIDYYIFKNVAVDKKNLKEAYAAAEKHLIDEKGEGNFDDKDRESTAFQFYRTSLGPENEYYRKPFWKDPDHPGEYIIKIKVPAFSYGTSDGSEFGYNPAALHDDFKKMSKGRSYQSEEEKEKALQDCCYKQMTRKKHPLILPTYYTKHDKLITFVHEAGDDKKIPAVFNRKLLQKGTVFQIPISMRGVFSSNNEHFGSAIKITKPNIIWWFGIDMQGEKLANIELQKMILEEHEGATGNDLLKPLKLDAIREMTMSTKKSEGDGSKFNFRLANTEVTPPVGKSSSSAMDSESDEDLSDDGNGVEEGFNSEDDLDDVTKANGSNFLEESEDEEVDIDPSVLAKLKARKRKGEKMEREAKKAKQG